MAREATNVQIQHIAIEAIKGAGVTLVSRNRAVPSHFIAHVDISRPALSIVMEVVVLRVGDAQVRHMSITPSDDSKMITTGALRGIPVDRLIREALGQAEFEVIPRPEVQRNAFYVPGEPEHQLRVSQDPVKSTAQERFDDIAKHAAKVYLDAVSEGSRKPAEAVATAIGRSRGTAARYIRRARELGVLPPTETAADSEATQ